MELIALEENKTQIREGYKKTEVGVIPNDWKVELLEGLTKRIGDGIHTTPKYSENGSYFFVNGNNLSNGSIIITENTKRVDRQEYLIHRRDLGTSTILLSINGTIGNIAYYNNENIVLGKSAAYIDLSAIVDKVYAYYYLQTKVVAEYFGNELTGSTIKNLGLGSIRRTPVPLPPTLAEQRAIAKALGDVDALISNLDKLIAKKKAIKQGAMQKLLKSPKQGGKRLPGFESEWEVKCLDEVADVIDPHPSHRAPAAVQSGIPFLGIGDFAENGNIIKASYRIVGEHIYGEHRDRYRLEEGLLGLGRVASIGKVVRLRSDIGKYAVSPTLGVIRATKVNSELLFFLLNSDYVKDQFKIVMSGSTRSSVGMIVLRKIQLQLPKSLEEQKAIASILSDMGSEIENLEKKKAKYQNIKQGMMQELLTGDTRLV